MRNNHECRIIGKMQVEEAGVIIQDLQAEEESYSLEETKRSILGGGESWNKKHTETKLKLLIPCLTDRNLWSGMWSVKHGRRGM